MNKILEDTANTISGKTSDKSQDENFGSIVLTIVIIGVILNLIRVIQECNRDDDAKFAKTTKDLCAKRGWFTKMRIRKAIRKEIGIANYKTYGKSLMESILETGDELTEEQLLELLEASKNV